MDDRYYKASEEVTLRFYQMPKALFGNPRYKGMNIASKAVYSILRDRQDLSIKNNWVDEEQRIYLVFDIESLAELIEMDRKSVMKYKKELTEYGLIEDKRVGRNKPNRIYVLKPELHTIYPQDQTVDTAWKSKKGTTGSVKNGLPEVQNFHPNDTEYSDTNLYKSNKPFPFYNWLEEENS